MTLRRIIKRIRKAPRVLRGKWRRRGAPVQFYIYDPRRNQQ